MGLQETSTIQGVYIKCTETYFMYGEVHFMIDNDEEYRFWKFYYYQVRGEDTAPVNVFCPVYDPASVIEPGTAIPQKV